MQTRPVAPAQRWGRTFAVIGLLLSCAAALVVLRHQHPKLITSEDIAIFAAALTASTAALSFAAAREARAAASDSRRALQLHYMPANVRLGFTLRDPNDPSAQMHYVPLPNPAYLWVTLLFWGDPQEEYSFVWVDDAGQSHERTVMPVSSLEHHIRLDGIVGREDTSGPISQIRAGDVQLKLLCKDRSTRSSWRWSRVWRAGDPLGSYKVDFELYD